jgi:hypothetical protein
MPVKAASMNTKTQKGHYTAVIPAFTSTSRAYGRR